MPTPAEINFDQYAAFRGESASEMVSRVEFQIIRASFVAVPNGVDSPFKDVLEELERRTAGGEDVFINGYKVDFESFGQDPNFKAANFIIHSGTDSQSVKDVAFLHLVRNILIDYTKTYDDIVENAENYVKVTDAKNAFHKDDTYFAGNAHNVKWVSLDGKEEYIFHETNEGWELVTDPVNQGSYNFIPSTESGSGHIALDVLTWEFFGNFVTDPSNEGDRSAIADPFEPTLLIVSTPVYGADETNDTLFVLNPVALPEYQYKFYGGSGNDTIISAQFADVVNGGDGVDAVAYWDSTSGVTVNLRLGFAFDGYGSRPDEGIDADNSTDKFEVLLSIENVFGSSYSDIIVGSDFDNALSGRGGIDHLYGGNGQDHLQGGGDNDWLQGGSGNDRLDGATGEDTAIYLGDYDDYTTTKAADGTITVVSGNVLELGTDILTDIEVIRFRDFEIQTSLIPVTVDPETPDAGVYHPGTAENDQIWGASGDDNLFGAGGDDQLIGSGGNDYLDGGEGTDSLYGGTGNDTLASWTGDDSINGGDGNDAIYGWSGNDRLKGDIGNDTILGESGSDVIFGGAGNDIIYGDGNENLYGAGAADIMYGGAGDDTLYGGETGTDIAVYLGEFDDYLITKAADGTVSIVSGNSTELGLDILSGIEVIRFQNFEIQTNLIPINPEPGTPVFGVRHEGNSGNEYIVGTSVQDTLFGLMGNDTIFGGDGNDLLYGGWGGRGESIGVDADSVFGGAGDDWLLSVGGNDTLLSGIGNDTIGITDSLDILNIDGGSGWDVLDIERMHLGADQLIFLSATSGSSFSDGTSFRNIEALRLFVGAGNDVVVSLSGNDSIYGGSGNDSLTTGAGNDLIDGGIGIDTLVGGLGDDIYFVDGEDVIFEEVSSGADVVNSSATFVLSANIETLLLTGTAAINGTGNSLNNHITGNGSNNTLNGVLGVDTLEGGSGNDTYITNGGDTLLEEENDGTDTVKSSVSIGLANNVENLILTGGVAVTGLGNSLNNTITGNGLNNTLNGGTGIDTLKGGLGDDTYVTDGSDIISEAASAGNDRVNSSASYTLSANVERLFLTGTAAINGTGNSLANHITGNAANNTLNGGTGIDTLVGGLGDDTYVTDGADVLSEAALGGLDTVRSSVNYTLGANIENLLLTGTTALKGTGNSLNNRISGNAEDNTISGGTGADTLLGGTGSDSITGGADRDFLYGGVDTVRDVFIFNSVTESASGATRDIVYNFVSGTDDLKLNVIDANSLLVGDQAFGFNGTSAKANSLWFVDVGTDIIVRGDTSGDSVYDFEIRIMNINTVVAGDFIL
jgi:trimeric autotransporter adhesin